LVSFIIFYILVPLASKQGQTLGKRASQLMVVNDKGYLMQWWQLPLRSVVLAATLFTALYTIFGSLFLFIGLIFVYLRTPGATHSADIEALYLTARNLSAESQGYLFMTFFIAFAIKMPIFPFHTWQPDTYTTSPSQGTMLLSGIMLKMGTYGVIRLIIPMFPLGIGIWGNTAIVLSIIGVIYGSIIAIQQKTAEMYISPEVKRYASI
jgi:NADH-quinone oxidoreductase subunit M